MNDRIPTKILPNGAIRYGVYDEQGNLLRYEYIRPEDEPTQAGSAINKANLLPDDVVNLLEIPSENPQIKDALAKLALSAGKFGYSITAKYSEGDPAANITIAGLTKIDGSDCVTDGNGEALGVSTSMTPTISISEFIDLEPYSSEIQSTDVITPVLITLNVKAGNITQINTSQNIKFARDVSVDALLIGGGYDAYSGEGGANGKTCYYSGISIPERVENACVIGAVNGGNTTFMGKTSASGSNSPGGAAANQFIGPAGDGSGGGTSPISTSFIVGGSGGGGGESALYPSGGKGANGGGDGGMGDATFPRSGGNASKPGGGGGGGGWGNDGRAGDGKGAAGALHIKWRYV